MASGKFYLYTRYERFWHWLQALLIACLLVTGLEVHGTFELIGYKRAVAWHAGLGVTWLVAFAFFVFWIATTGEWRQYLPTTKKMFEVMSLSKVVLPQPLGPSRQTSSPGRTANDTRDRTGVRS